MAWSMAGSRAMMRRMNSRRTGCVSGRSGPAVASVPTNRPMICSAKPARTAANLRRAPPKSVAARTTPAQTIPMQISLTRVTANMKTSWEAPPVAPSSSLATITAV